MINFYNQNRIEIPSKLVPVNTPSSSQGLTNIEVNSNSIAPRSFKNILNQKVFTLKRYNHILNLLKTSNIKYDTLPSFSTVNKHFDNNNSSTLNGVGVGVNVSTSPSLLSNLNINGSIYSLPNTSSTSVLEGDKAVRSGRINLRKYIKSMSMFNSELAGYKTISYHFNKGNNILIRNLTSTVYTFLNYAFYSIDCLISKPVFVSTPEKVVIQLFYHQASDLDLKNRNHIETKSTFLNLNSEHLQKICVILTKLYGKPVELELVRLYYPFLESNILAGFLGLNGDTITFRILMRMLFEKATIKNPTKRIQKTTSSRLPSFISGIKIRLGGRLLTQRVIPRMSVKTVNKGSLARGKTNFVEFSRFTNKNKRGAYSISVTMGHIF